ncbi:hypothetical protein PBY51_003385 [Eleginops maclovinus]|uniref:HAT C-terminal dimerisation domain-containing protein n=1 Tax=Eleginops maclovinus TaxID=56733 RepID=A0AAN7X9Z7_ELEMC|nr:hypothetical protein PBY51_003385 [Eleginops maclovinus]
MNSLLRSGAEQDIMRMRGVARQRVQSKQVVLVRAMKRIYLRKLIHMMGHLLPPDADTDQEILRFNVDQALPSFQHGEDVVKWWAVVFNTGKYPALCQAVKAALSIFHGALVESSFSVMGTIIHQRSTSMKISTLSAVQTVNTLCRPGTRLGWKCSEGRI